MELACQCPAVVCCRCTPTQKAQIVRLLQERTGKLTCAVGEQDIKLGHGFLGVGGGGDHSSNSPDDDYSPPGVLFFFFF